MLLVTRALVASSSSNTTHTKKRWLSKGHLAHMGPAAPTSPVAEEWTQDYRLLPPFAKKRTTDIYYISLTGNKKSVFPMVFTSMASENPMGFPLGFLMPLE